MSNFPRARFGMAVAVAFICGLIFASGMDLTHFGWAQTRVSGGPSVPAAAVSSLAETQSGFEAVVDRVKPAVVTIHVAKYAQPAAQQRPRARGQRQPQQQQQQVPPGFEDFMKQFGGDAQPPDQSDQPREGAGSGFIVSKDGYILTNNHVVAGMDRVQVILVDKRQFDAKVIGRDSTTDVAVIKIDGDNFPTVPLGDDATARVGQWVLAVGNPLELDFTVTAGIISAKGRSNLPLPGRGDYSITDFIQTDAAINPGNSGGPLVNIRGEVIGMNSAIASGTGYYAGYGFAIPIGLAHQVMNDLIKYGTVKRAIVGVSLQEVTPEDAQAAGLKDIRGAKVVDFTNEQSPAKKSGVEIGDIIVAADGKPIDQVSTLQRIIRGLSIGETVKLDVQRFGQTKQIAVKLTEVSPVTATVVAARSGSNATADDENLSSKTYDKLGLSVSTMPTSFTSGENIPASARDGLLVTKVATRGEAYDKAINEKADIIEEVLYPARRDIRSVKDMDQAMSGLKSGDVITMRLYTIGRGNRVVSFRIP